MTKFSKALRYSAAVFAVFLTLQGLTIAYAADDLTRVLSRLDAAAVKFKSAEADIVTDIVQVQPLPDDDKQTGTILFERKGTDLQMALHLKTDNGRAVSKELVYASGVGKLYEPQLKQIDVYKAGNNQALADTVLTLGFGGSGKDLQKSWQITYVGTEQVEGKATDKLVLIPKDEGLRNTYPKVILWVDAANGLAVKQQFFDASGNYKLAIYQNVRLNGSVPSGAFEIKAPKDTRVVNH